MIIYKDNYDTTTTAANKSMGFDLSVIQSYFCYYQLCNWKAGEELRKSTFEDDIWSVQYNCEKVFGAYIAGL